MPYITFLFVLRRLTEGALYQKHTGSFTSTYTISHTHRSLTIDLKISGGQFKVSAFKEELGVKRL